MPNAGTLAPPQFILSIAYVVADGPSDDDLASKTFPTALPPGRRHKDDSVFIGFDNHFSGDKKPPEGGFMCGFSSLRGCELHASRAPELMFKKKLL